MFGADAAHGHIAVFGSLRARFQPFGGLASAEHLIAPRRRKSTEMLGRWASPAPEEIAALAA